MPRRTVAALLGPLLVTALGAASCGGARAAVPSGAVGCAPAGSVQYSGARPGDCVASAGHHFVVAVDGYEVLVGNWKRTTDDLGRHLICAGTNIEDVGQAPERLLPAQLELRTPDGTIEPGAPAVTNGLTAGRLHPGQQEGGSVCWPDPGLGGQYQAVFVPPAAKPGGQGARAIWLITFLPR